MAISFLVMEDDGITIDRKDLMIPIMNRKLFEEYSETDRAIIAIGNNDLHYLRDLVRTDVDNEAKWNNKDERDNVRMNLLVYLEELCRTFEYPQVHCKIEDYNPQ